nr:DJ-1/PfpI family protein [uncultured Clostridium sp.]
MGKILCYVYNNMADFEVSLLLHRLRNTGKKEIVSVSGNLELKTAQSGLTYQPDRKISDIDNLDDVEALIIPGGPIDNGQNDICPLIRQMDDRKKLIGAICFGPQFLGRAGLLDRYHYTTSCSQEKILILSCDDPFNRKNEVISRVVTDQHIITAQGYAFVDFALEICRYLKIFDSDLQEYEQIGRIGEFEHGNWSRF